MLKSLIGKTHETLIFERRVRVLIEKIGALVPSNSKMMDVGTGDGQIAKAIGEQSDKVDVHGIDIMLRKTTHIPVEVFDGVTMPSADKSS
ncbi:MAG: SAM-dependent methyltransferase, partial [Lentilitoribacter sp.]